MRRDLLFKRRRPVLRPFQVYNGHGFSKDMAILYAAHSIAPFYSLADVKSQEAFALEMEEVARQAKVWIADDRNVEYGGVGPVAVFAVADDGWKHEPHVEYFPWATARNKLTVTVAFLNMMRKSKNVGCCFIKSLEDSVKLFERCRRYGVLFASGKIIGGDVRGDEYLYSIKGRK